VCAEPEKTRESIGPFVVSRSTAALFEKALKAAKAETKDDSSDRNPSDKAL
jgi:hypothetical protein